jgi:competence protein ComEC
MAHLPWLIAASGAAGVFLLAREKWLPALLAWCAIFFALGAAGEARLLAREWRSRAAFEVVQEHAALLASIEGRVQRRAEPRGTTWLVWLAPKSRLASAGEWIKFPAPLPVQFRSPSPEETAVLLALETGDAVSFTGRAFELEHGRGADSPDRWARSHGAIVRFEARTISTPSLTPDRDLRGQMYALCTSASRGTATFIASSLPEKRGALLSAMLLGNTDELSIAQRESFRRTGLVHLFSVSGFHTMLVGLLTYRLLGILGLGRRLRVAAFLMALVVFAGIVGLETPVLRAAALLAAHAIATLLARPVDSLAALSTVFLAMILIQPQAVHTLEFQLTFLCALVLVLTQPWCLMMEERLGPKFGWGRLGRMGLLLLQTGFVSSMVQLAATPLLASWFGQVSLIAPVANALFSFLAAQIMLVAFLLSVVSTAIPDTAGIMLGVLGPFLALLDAGVAWLASAPFAVVPSGQWPAELTVMWLVGLFATPWVLEGQSPWPTLRRSAAGLVLLASVAWAWHHIQPGRAPLTVNFIDVGQGDAILLEAANGARGLIDGGPALQTVRWLDTQGIRELDFVAASHADLDHIGGIPAVLRSCKVGQIFTGGTISNSGAFRDMEAARLDARIPITQLARGSSLQFGSPPIRIDVLHPTPEFLAAGVERNEASLVLLVTAPGGQRLLLTGDAEKGAEASMLAAGILGPVEVLKAGHHGSRDSTGEGLLDATRPGIVVLSCGAGNNFGHPTPEVMERAAAANSETWRTDLDGTVTFRFAMDGAWQVSGSRREGIEFIPAN